MAKLRTRRARCELLEIVQKHHAERYKDWITPNDWRYISPGPERRKRLIAYLKEHEKIPVNRKWQANTHYDPDLKKLLKKGVIFMKKEGAIPRQTYIYLKEV